MTPQQQRTTASWFYTLLCMSFHAAFSVEGQAATWMELGDAGQLISTAQAASGFGELESIQGTINGLDVDLFQIWVSSTEQTLSFSATVVVPPDGDWALRPQLFLFDSSGLAIYGTDGVSNNRLPSYTSLTPTAPGLYYLAVSPYDIDPFSPKGTSGTDYPLLPTQWSGGGGIYVPGGLGSGMSLGGWGGSYSGIESAYIVHLTGAELVAAPVPVPAAIWSLGFGLALLMGLRHLSRVSMDTDRRPKWVR